MPKPNFPWKELMRFGLNQLSLSPHEFWRCTLRELHAATGSVPAPLQRQNLSDLMQRFPDANHD
jgi:uncharacterized phage protein (TIGR02216 family)